MDSAFRTILQPTKSSIEISHRDKVLCIGSCFAEHIGERLISYKIPTCLNPFGIVYNPISIAESLELLLETDFVFSKKNNQLVESPIGWNSFSHHGQFSHPEKEVVLDKINHALKETRDFLNNTTKLILTFGTANVFVYKKTRQIVANCHKVPQQEFEKRRLTIEEITTSITIILQKLKKAFPHLEVIMTVSPVRHIRDGLVENQRSKSTLVMALNQIVEQHDFVHYFPSYELLLDDLRDYRFYKKDMIHPTEMAVDYIWDFFTKTWFSQNTIELNQKIKKIKDAANHRPLQPDSAGHLDFVKKQLVLIKEMEGEYDFLSFEKEKRGYEIQLLENT